MLIPSHFPYTSTAVRQWLTHKLMLRLPHGPESVLYIIPKYSNYRWIQLCKSKLPGSWQKFQKCLSALSSNFMWSKAKHTRTNQKYKSTSNNQNNNTQHQTTKTTTNDKSLDATNMRFAELQRWIRGDWDFCCAGVVFFLCNGLTVGSKHGFPQVFFGCKKTPKKLQWFLHVKVRYIIKQRYEYRYFQHRDVWNQEI